MNRWERIVYKAMMVNERRAADEELSRPTTTASNTTVPQSLLQQTNIDAILQTADEVEDENPTVARICKNKKFFSSRIGFMRSC
jgi:callose synthase